MTPRTRANVDYPLVGGLAVEQYLPASTRKPTFPCFTTPRVFFGNESLHAARLLRRDPGLEAALRVNGFTIPMLGDQDRR